MKRRRWFRPLVFVVLGILVIQVASVILGFIPSTALGDCSLLSLDADPPPCNDAQIGSYLLFLVSFTVGVLLQAATLAVLGVVALRDWRRRVRPENSPQL